MTRPSWNQYFLNIAQAVSLRSHDEETQVGCVIVDENRHIIATGYNGFPPGIDDEMYPRTRPGKYPYMIHAEINALLHATKSVRGATMYCTHSPCNDCAKAIISAGIRSLFFRDSRPDTPVTLLWDSNVEMERLK